jgi:predicted CXXCH cytochrome family protein
MSLPLPTGAAEDTVVLFPPDLTLVKEGKVKIFAFGNGGTPIPLSVNGIARDPLKGGSLQSGQADLRPGMNFVDVGEKRLRVFREEGAGTDRFRFLPENDEAPLVFQAYRVHPALDDGCEGCHAIVGGKLSAKGQKEACYGCHENFEKGEGKKKFVHAPVAAGECTGCHDPHYSVRPNLQKLEKGCLECHDVQPGDVSVHYPVREGRCTECHGPHVADVPGQLVRSGNGLCLECHKNTHSHHPFGPTGKRQEVTRVPPDIPMNSDQFSCLACHLPHQSSERRLFRKSQGELCRTCHPV